MNRIFTLILLLAITFSGNTPVVAGPPTADAEWVRVYPNPVLTDATIRLSRDIDVEFSKVSIVVYNIVGKEVFRVNNIKDYEVRFNREGFLSGVYIYQLKVDDKVVSTGRFTVK